MLEAYIVKNNRLIKTSIKLKKSLRVIKFSFNCSFKRKIYYAIIFETFQTFLILTFFYL